jgi:hypothetical protein
MGDRALYHADLPALSRFSYAPIVSRFCTPARAQTLHSELAAARKAVKSPASVAAAVHALSWLAALNRTGSRGYRGVTAPLEYLAESIARCTGARMGARTAANAARILEAAGLVELGLAGRGNPVKAKDGKIYRRGVSTWTLTPAAISLWSRPRTSVQLGENLSANREKEGFPSGEYLDARAVDPGPAAPAPSVQPIREVKAPEAGASAPSLGLIGPRKAREPNGVRPRTAPQRLISGRPSRTEPETRARGVRALAYDLESELLRRGRSSREISDCVGRVLTESAPGYRGPVSQPWDDWVWRWRKLPTAERRLALSCAIWPGVRATLKRSFVARLPQAARFSPKRPWNVEPGPRAPYVPPPPPPPPPATAEIAIARVGDLELSSIFRRLQARGAF